MIVSQDAETIFNIFLHITILFGFLTSFFFIYIRKIQEETIQNLLEENINTKVSELLTRSNDLVGKITNPSDLIKWKELHELSSKLVEQTKGKLPEIEANNKKIMWYGIGITFMFFVMTCTAALVLHLQGKHINVIHILVENIVVFAFVGTIELIFFQTVARKYIPVMPDTVAATVLERLKHHVTN